MPTLPPDGDANPAPETALSALSPGATVGQGRFTLKKIIGHGGMGMVWLAQDEHLQEPVALKFLPSQVGFDPAAISQLRKETSRSRKLSHPNIVRIHDFRQREGEPSFIAMEFVDGQTLHALRFQQPNELFSWDKLAPCVRQLCDALDYAHGEKIVHRDLKPSNMMLDSNGRLKLADFGIASVISDSMSRISNQPASGTLPYMSPQQINGERPQATDDIYSLGATLYELLTGTPPFHSGQILHQILNNEPIPPTARLAELGLENEIPPAVEAMIMSCLAKDPPKRPQSTRAVADWIGLEAAPHPQSLAATVVQTEEKLTGVRNPSREKLIWMAVVLILLLGAGGWVWMKNKPSVESSQHDAMPANISAATTAPPNSERVVFSEDFEAFKSKGDSTKGLRWNTNSEPHPGQQRSIKVEGTNHFLQLEAQAMSNSWPILTLGHADFQPEWKKLKFSLRIRTRRLRLISDERDAGAALVVFGWFAAYREQLTHTAFLKVDSDWTLIETIVQIPAGAMCVSFSPVLSGCKSGIADFDDIKVMVLEENLSPIAQLPKPVANNTDVGRIVLTENFETLDAEGKPINYNYWRAAAVGEKQMIRIENGNSFLEYEASATTNWMQKAGFNLDLKPEWKTLKVSVRIRTQSLSPRPGSGAILCATFADELTDAARSWKTIKEYKTSYMGTNSDWQLQEIILPVPSTAKHLILSPTLAYATGLAGFDDIIVTVVEENIPAR